MNPTWKAPCECLLFLIYKDKKNDWYDQIQMISLETHLTRNSTAVKDTCPHLTFAFNIFIVRLRTDTAVVAPNRSVIQQNNYKLT